MMYVEFLSYTYVNFQKLCKNAETTNFGSEIGAHLIMIEKWDESYFLVFFMSFLLLCNITGKEEKFFQIQNQNVNLNFSKIPPS